MTRVPLVYRDATGELETDGRALRVAIGETRFAGWERRPRGTGYRG